MSASRHDSPYSGWTTHAEIEFIDRLASGKNGLQKLRGYLAAMTRRTDFGQMNVDEVLFYARERLQLLERKAASRGGHADPLG